MDRKVYIPSNSALQWTNRILPQSFDKTWKVIAKFVLIIATLGTISAVTVTRDLIVSAYRSFTYKKPPPPKPPTTWENIQLGAKAVITGIAGSALMPFMPTYQLAGANNSFAKWGFLTGHIAGTSTILRLIAGRNAALATLGVHLAAYSITQIKNLDRKA